MPKRIMVVNDTPIILDLFREILTDEGYEVCLYSYPTQALPDLDQIKPDLIILDHMFGAEQRGWQMLQALKMKRDTELIPVIVCTTATRVVQEIEGWLLAKGVIVVAKPFNIDDLLSAVQKALQLQTNALAM